LLQLQQSYAEPRFSQDSDKAGRIVFIKRSDILATIVKSLSGLDLVSR
jgi:hypothetical protein